MIVANIVEPEVTAYFNGNGLNFEDGENTNTVIYGFIPQRETVALEGIYSEPENWLGKWYLNLEEDTIWFENEAEIEAYLLENATNLSGKSLTFYAYNSYEIVFDPNGGTGEMNNQIGYTYEGLDLSANEFTRDSFDFSRWNTKADGTGTNYLNEAEVMNLANGGGSIRLYAIWVECGPNRICYDGNGIDNLGLNKQSVSSNSSVTLLTPNLERAGYGFAGWSTSEFGLSDSEARIYGPSETISTGNLSMEGIKLYAVWVTSAGYLQNWGCPDDDVFPVGSVTALTDIRDDNVYTVAKLADGSCWMVENLRLGGATELTLTENETESAGSLPVSVSSWTANSSPVTVKKMNSSNLGSSNAWTSSNNSIIFRYGNYYSWSAAINSNTAVNSGTVNTSICPAGWTLPSPGGTKRSYRKLNDAIDGKWTTFPNNFVYSGSYMRGATAKGENGYYWTTSVYGAESAYMLGIGSSTNYYNVNKNTGGAIRCVHLPIEKSL